MALPIIQLTGKPFAQGQTHGQTLHNAIAKNLDLYFYRFQHECGLQKDMVLQRAELYQAEIAQRHPDYAAGMAGIAAGCGADLVEIAALNVRYEILYYQYAVKGLADGCTSLVVERERSAENNLILAQNWDWFPDAQGAILHTKRSDHFETLAFTEAGIFGGKIGLNSAGIGLLINGLIALEDDWSLLNKPFHVRCYEILQQSTLKDAMAVVTSERRACSANYVIGSAESGVVNIEAAPDTVAHIRPKNGCIVHTNHFIDPASLGIRQPEAERIHTEHRYQRLSQLLPTDAKISDADIKSWLSDHDGFPDSICQHADPKLPDAERYGTVVSLVLNLDQLTMQIAAGNPCQHPFETVALAASARQMPPMLA